MLGPVDPSLPADPPFNVEIVSTHRGSVALASGVPVEARRSTADIDATDIIIVPSVLLGAEGWKIGRYPQLVDWARDMHARGALLCSACSGVFLLAETGLFDGHDTTFIGAMSTPSRASSQMFRCNRSAFWSSPASARSWSRQAPR